MIRAARQSTGLLRHVWLTLATLAIALKILVPPGFMAGPATQDLPFALVLCTGQGAIIIQPGDALPGHGDHAPAPADSAQDHPCLFAGHSLGAPPPDLAVVAVIDFAAYDPRPQIGATAPAPGRGSAGPPLPARGPPALLI